MCHREQAHDKAHVTLCNNIACALMGIHYASKRQDRQVKLCLKQHICQPAHFSLN